MVEIRVIEKTISEVENKLKLILSDLSKISYMESALKADVTFDVKRFLYDKLAEIYLKRKMVDRAALAISKKVAITTTIKEKVSAYLQAGDLFAKAGKVIDSEYMFNKAILESSQQEKEGIREKMKSVFLRESEILEESGKKASCLVFYEHLLGMGLSFDERNKIKQKLLLVYKALGKFSEARALDVS